MCHSQIAFFFRMRRYLFAPQFDRQFVAENRCQRWKFLFQLANYVVDSNWQEIHTLTIDAIEQVADATAFWLQNEIMHTR